MDFMELSWSYSSWISIQYSLTKPSSHLTLSTTEKGIPKDLMNWSANLMHPERNFLKRLNAQII